MNSTEPTIYMRSAAEHLNRAAETLRQFNDFGFNADTAALALEELAAKLASYATVTKARHG